MEGAILFISVVACVYLDSGNFRCKNFNGIYCG